MYGYEQFKSADGLSMVTKMDDRSIVLGPSDNTRVSPLEGKISKIYM